MVRNNSFRQAIIAIYKGFGSSQFFRHGLGFNCNVKISELSFHWHDCLATNGAAIGRLGMLIETFLMNAMTASHKNNPIRGRKHVLATDRAIALR